MADLLNQYADDATSYKGLLNIETLGQPFDANLRNITDGMDNVSALSLSTAFAKIAGTGVLSGGSAILGSLNASTFAIWYGGLTPTVSNWTIAYDAGTIYLGNNTQFRSGLTYVGGYNSNGFYWGTGTITQNGVLTVKGAGGNIFSGRNSANAEKFTILDSGAVVAYDNITTYGFLNCANDVTAGTNSSLIINSKIKFTSALDGSLRITNFAGNNFSILNLGPATSAFPMLKVNGTTLEVKLGDDSAYTNIHAYSYILKTSGGSTIGSLASLSSDSIFQISAASGKSMIFYSGGSIAAFADTGQRWNFGASATTYPSAKLAIDSTNMGFLPPRMTTAQRTAISSPAAGLMVYDTDTNKSYTYDGSTWQAHW
jgi:hypothetical protein